MSRMPRTSSLDRVSARRQLPSPGKRETDRVKEPLAPIKPTWEPECIERGIVRFGTPNRSGSPCAVRAGGTKSAARSWHGASPRQRHALSERGQGVRRGRWLDAVADLRRRAVGLGTS
jgi:hypothetical protein